MTRTAVRRMGGRGLRARGPMTRQRGRGTAAPRLTSCLLVTAMAAAAVACGESLSLEPLPPSAADTAFDIQVRFWGAPPDETVAFRIERAAQRWERVIIGSLPDVRVTGNIGCGPGSPAIDETVDDLVVYVRIVELEALAESGPCILRPGSLLPVTGTVWLDGPERLEDQHVSALEALVTHEVGHALGFGTLWQDFGLLQDPTSAGGSDPHFTGARALAQFDDAGGTSYRGAKVPVEDSGGAGTADSHWRSSVFGTSELMSFTVLLGNNALSRVTVGAMEDLGYEVDFRAADEYSLPMPARAGAVERPPAERLLTVGGKRRPPF